MAGAATIPLVIDESVERRFWSFVDATGGPDSCWPWLGHLQKGYGYLKVNGRQIAATRISLKIATGEDPGDLHALHRCDAPPCVNPRHLWAGTQADNARDRRDKGRQASKRGANNGRARLTPRGVVVVREMHAGGLSYGAIAARLGISKATVGKVVAGKSWSSR